MHIDVPIIIMHITALAAIYIFFSITLFENEKKYTFIDAVTIEIHINFSSTRFLHWLLRYTTDVNIAQQVRGLVYFKFIISVQIRFNGDL